MKQSKVLFFLLVSLLGTGSVLPIKTAFAAASVDVSPTGPRIERASLELAQTEALNPTSTLQFTPPVLTDRRRPGGRSSGGASRGSCTLNEQQTPLTALVPTTQVTPDDAPEYESVFSLTSEARPAFWFYVPYELSSTPLELVIQDENNNTLSQHRFAGNAGSAGSAGSGPGLIQVNLPETAPALAPETLYHWFFLAYCDDNNPAFVEGWIERMPLDAELASKLTGASPREQIEFYANNGIWHEALATLGQQYLASPSDPTLTNDWNSLLESVNLDPIAEQRLIDCCMAAPSSQP